MKRYCFLAWILVVSCAITCVIASDEQNELLPPITTPWDFYAYETPEVTLWRVDSDTFRVAEVRNWNGKVMWRSKGYGDVTWAFQDSTGHEIGEGFYHIRVEKSDKVHWASMNVHWKQHIAILEDQGHHATLLSAGPNFGTGFTITVTNQDSIAWELTDLAWSDGTMEAMPIPIEITTPDSIVRRTVVLLPYQANAYRSRFISLYPVYLDSLKFELLTKSVEQPSDTTSAKP
ncbi:hypothetical protein AMJ86_03905 [bacterium SM23_57]|nr:MAG: hypothetical protein AMJ86_03905 [bacterium SM23_57]